MGTAAGRILLAVSSSLAGACSPPLTHVVPPADAKSALLLIEETRGPLLLATSLEPGAELELPDGASPDAPIRVFFHRWRLAELQLDPGRVEAPGATDMGRPLPPALVTLEAKVGSSGDEWEPLADDEALRLMHRLPTLDLLRCAQEDGCLSREDERDIACTMPCPPSPEPEAAEPSSAVADPPAELEPPSPVQMLPCPVGWSTRPAEGVTPATCEPPALPPKSSCGRFEARFHGDSSCTPIGPPCPVGEFASPTNLPPGRPVFYVRADGALGGDGSLASPFGQLGEALAQIPDDSVLLLAKGSFAERVEIDSRVTIIGACVEQTEILVPAAEGCCEPLILVDSRAGAHLSNLRARGPSILLRVDGVGPYEVQEMLFEPESERSGGIVATNGAQLTGRRVAVRGAGEEGIQSLTGAKLELEEVFIEAGRSAVRVQHEGSELDLRRLVVHEPEGYEMSRAFWAHDAGVLRVESAEVHRSMTTAIEVTSGGNASFVDLVVSSLRTSFPRGSDVVHLSDGGQLRLDESRFTGGDSMLVRAVGAASTLTMTRSLLRGGERPVAGFVFGALWASDAELVLDRVVIEQNAGIGLRLDGRAHARVTDVLLSDNDREGDIGGAPGGAVLLEAEAALELDRGVIADNAGVGVRLFGSARAALRNVLVTAQRRRPGATFLQEGVGISVEGDSGVEVDHASIGGNDGPALWAQGSVTATLTQTLVTARQTVPDGHADVIVAYGARLQLRDVHSVFSRVSAHEATLVLQDVELRGRQDLEVPLLAAPGSVLVADRLIIDHPDILAPAFHIIESTATLRDLWLRSGRLRADDANVTIERLHSQDGELQIEGSGRYSATDLVVVTPQENGLSIGPETVVSLRRAELRDAPGRGIRLAEGSRLDAEDLIVEGNRIGLTALDQAEARVTGFRFAQNADVGLVFDPTVAQTETRELRWTDGLLSQQPVGIRVFPDYDLVGIAVRVRYEQVPTVVQY